MAICPKGKTSRGRRNKRRAQRWTISTATLVSCPSCQELTLPHKACRSCGNYKRVEVYKVGS